MRVDAEVEVAFQGAAAQKPAPFRRADGALQALGGDGILTAHVEVALVRADGVAGDRHTFQQAMGVGLHHRAVHVGAGVALVAVGDDVFLVAFRLAHQVPLNAGGVAGAAAPAQAALGEGRADLFRRHLAQGMGKRGIAAPSHVVF